MEEMGENEGGSKIWIALVAAGVAAAGAGLYFGQSLLHPSTVVPVAVPKDESPLARMTLEQGDGLMREKAKDLSAESRWATWLKTEDLLRRLAAATALVADGKSPRASLEFLAPGQPFRVVQKNGGVYADPRSYSRYDGVADVIRSIDADRAAAVIGELMPLLQKAYAELGGPKGDFKDAWLQAINGLLSTPVVQGDLRLRKKVVTYALADEALEKLSPAQKHLLRMGPQNAVKIQAKLRQIALAMGVPETKLSVPAAYSPKAP